MNLHLNEILTSPETFFKQAKEKRIVRPLLIYLGFTFVYALLSGIVQMLIPTKDIPFPTLADGVSAFLITFVLFGVSIFIATFVLHFLLRWVKGKGTYVQTFTAYVLVSEAVFLLVLLPILVLNVLLYFFNLEMNAFVGTITPVGVVLAIVLAFLATLVLAAFLYSVMLHVIAQATIHKLATIKAFFAVIVMPVLLLALIFALSFIFALPAVPYG